MGEWAYFLNELHEPETVQEARASPESSFWQEAMQNEINSMYKNEVWTLDKLPNGQTPINCKRVFKKKIGPDLNLSSYKARLAARGFSWKRGVNYDEIFTAVVRFESVRTLLSLASNCNLKLHEMDVSAAFLNGELEEEIYLSQPPGFVVERKENYFC